MPFQGFLYQIEPLPGNGQCLFISKIVYICTVNQTHYLKLCSHLPPPRHNNRAKAAATVLILSLVLPLFGLAQNGQKWATQGNSISNTDFLGTINNQPLVFKVNNAQELTILTNGNVGVGTANPAERFVVAGNISATGGVFANTLNASQSISVGGFSILSNGTVDTVNSTAGNVFLNAAILNANGTINAKAINVTSNITSDSLHVNVLGPLKGDSIINLDPVAQVPIAPIVQFNGSRLRFPPIQCLCPLLFSSQYGFQFTGPNYNCNTGVVIGNINGQAIYPSGLAISACGRNNQLSIFTPNTNNNVFNVDNNGNTLIAGTLGIGTNTPQEQVDIWGPNGGPTTVRLFSTSRFTASTLWTNSGSFGYGFGIDANDNGAIYADYNLPREVLIINKAGQVSIGVPVNKMDGNYNLYVANGILTEHVRVTPQSSVSWSDYVFEKGYKLKPIKDVEKFINEKGHLEDVPTAVDVKKDGIDVAKMDAIILKKIEENTLYIIGLNNEIECLKKENNELKSETEELKMEVRRLTQTK